LGKEIISLPYIEKNSGDWSSATNHKIFGKVDGSLGSSQLKKINIKRDASNFFI
jgi:hypothetical protein